MSSDRPDLAAGEPRQAQPDPAPLAAALALAQTQRAFETPALREAAAAFARAHRDAGLGPERLLVAVKQLVRGAALPGMGEWFRTRVTDRLIVWGIEAYYGLPHDARTGADGSAEP
jgi:hypothetical protein